MPRNFIPSVEKGIIDYLKEGPLGFPVVDIAVALVDGSYHSVDFVGCRVPDGGAHRHDAKACRTARPVLLEPIMHVKIHVPSDSTASVNGVISTRRGKILGFDSRQGWQGWDTVEARDPAIRAARSDRRAALADPGRGDLRAEIRSSGRTHRQARRDRGGRAEIGGLKTLDYIRIVISICRRPVSASGPPAHGGVHGYRYRHYKSPSRNDREELCPRFSPTPTSCISRRTPIIGTSPGRSFPRSIPCSKASTTNCTMPRTPSPNASARSGRFAPGQLRVVREARLDQGGQRRSARRDDHDRQSRHGP